MGAVVDTREVIEHLDNEGYWYSQTPMSHKAYETICADMGKILEKYDVCVREDAVRDVNRATKIMLHTDGYTANYVCWWCVWSGAPIVANKIVDVNDIIAQMTDEEYDLILNNEVVHEGPTRSHYMESPIIWKDDTGKHQIAFSGVWNHQTTEFANHIVDTFWNVLVRAKDSIRRFSLENGQMLFIDNRRMLHGRDELGDNLERHLKRIWISSDPT